ncbi:MFS transporter [Alicyclobacillus fodiniaquatilis]|uniref:MFS transporter n=1 Tax=Alicyclobacillus fodiniaquatilis TaxID=1661150 RepID=A0ABW4JPZ8_9BACL
MKIQAAAPFWIISYTMVVIMMGTNIPSPLYGLYGEMWNFSSGMTTLLFAMYAIVLVPSSLVFGQLSDSLGRKKLLLLGILVSAIGSVSFISAHHTGTLLVSRAVQGLCVGIWNGPAIATMAELRPAHRKIATLVASISIAVGIATGPLYAGLLAQYAPWPIRLPYAIHLMLLIPALVGVAMMPETVRQVTKSRRLHLPNVPKSIRRSFLITCFGGVVAWAVAGFFMVIAPSYVTTLVGIHNLAISGAIVSLMFCCSTLAQITLKRLTARTSIIIGFTLLMLGILGVIISISGQQLWLLLISTMLAGVGHGPVAAATLAMASELAPPQSRADVVSSYYAIGYLGICLPVLGLGFVAEWIGLYHGILIFASVIAAAMLLLAGMVLFHFRPADNSTEEVGEGA